MGKVLKPFEVDSIYYEVKAFLDDRYVAQPPYSDVGEFVRFKEAGYGALSPLSMRYQNRTRTPDWVAHTLGLAFFDPDTEEAPIPVPVTIACRALASNRPQPDDLLQSTYNEIIHVDVNRSVRVESHSTNLGSAMAPIVSRYVMGTLADMGYDFNEPTSLYIDTYCSTGEYSDGVTHIANHLGDMVQAVLSGITGKFFFSEPNAHEVPIGERNETYSEAIRSVLSQLFSMGAGAQKEGYYKVEGEFMTVKGVETLLPYHSFDDLKRLCEARVQVSLSGRPRAFSEFYKKSLDLKYVKQIDNFFELWGKNEVNQLRPAFIITDPGEEDHPLMSHFHEFYIRFGPSARFYMHAYIRSTTDDKNAFHTLTYLQKILDIIITVRDTPDENEDPLGLKGRAFMTPPPGPINQGRRGPPSKRTRGSVVRRPVDDDDDSTAF